MSARTAPSQTTISCFVRRIYVTPETWDTPASHQVVEEPELWCVSCRSQYPHEDVDEDEEAE